MRLGRVQVLQGALGMARLVVLAVGPLMRTMERRVPEALAPIEQAQRGLVLEVLALVPLVQIERELVLEEQPPMMQVQVPTVQVLKAVEQPPNSKRTN